MDAQTLRSTIKTSRDLMRKDEGLSSDVERLPQFSWMLFLKCFHDHEVKREKNSKKYIRILPNNLRWEHWTDKKNIPDSKLISFVNEQLFPKLANLDKNCDSSQKQHIASMFKGFKNSVQSPSILREIIEKIDTLSFASSDDIHTMAKMYEDMLIEMKDASGQNGEFYTPRPVIRFIVNIVKPSLKKKEIVLDPASGTGGFLSESLDYMRKQAKTPAEKKQLYEKTLFGIEKKPLPYLLGMMNLILHEIEDPNILKRNTLAHPFSEITEQERFDCIMTNPPFGGQEENTIAQNLPKEMQTTDTALAFLLFIMESLKKNGRCGVILPNGPLFAGGVAGKIKEEILKKFNLHTIIRLPETVFEPYTTIATNILFFDKTKPTKEIWYYQMNVDERLRGASRAKNPKYTKSNPIAYEDFAEIEKWFKKKTEQENAWKVSVADIKDFNLDVKNPNDVEETVDLAPHELIDNIIADEAKTMKLLQEVKDLIAKEIPK
jgi:type I restriction enzyme M protein